MKTYWLWVVLALSVSSLSAAEIALTLPHGRSAYQTNEIIPIALHRSDTRLIPAGELLLRLQGPGGSSIAFTFPLKAVPVQEENARAIEHVQLNGYLLRPGNYALIAECDGAQAQAVFEIVSHVRRSTFRLVDWGTDIQPGDLPAMGEHSLGFNTILGVNNNGDEAIRAGLDYMRVCSMGGGHTLDLRKECDWSDPYVVQGAAARVTAQALADRTMPNTIGVHFYDEQGLTSQTHPGTGEMTPHNIPIHDEIFRNTFGFEPPQYNKIDPKNADDVESWLNWGRWKTQLLESAWQRPDFGVHRTRSDLLTSNQSIWAWEYSTAGHYFNEVRGLDVLFGHGKYSWANVAGFYLPPMTWEFGRARNNAAQSWHLPGWYSEQSDLFRLEQYMSFQLHLTGIGKPPWLHVHRPRGYDPKDEWCSIQRLFPDITDGVVESNKRMAKLGTIFTTMPVTRPAAAILYSLSNNLYYQAADMSATRQESGHLKCLNNLYLASKMAQLELFPLVEEDVLDGSLAAHHKAVVLTGITGLDPKVISALQGFIRGGGTVLMTDDCTVIIAGAVKLGVPGRYEKPPLDTIPAEYRRMAEPLQQSSYLVEPLRRALAALNIKPVLETENREIFASRQGNDEIEYIFASNAAWDGGVAEPTSIRAATAAISLPADGRPVYDAVLARKASEFQLRNNKLTAVFRFGAGQMRAFARTARPIGGIEVQNALLNTDFLKPHNPISVILSATLVDGNGKILAGSAPLRIRLIDPLGHVRFDLFRATERGIVTLALPLAANDAAGQWAVTISELLSGTTGTTSFNYQPAPECGAAAGIVNGAVTFADDYRKTFEFFAAYNNVTIVAGSSEYSQAAAQRLAKVLSTLDIKSTQTPLAEAARPRPLTEDEAKTWCGLMYAGSGAIKAGDGNSPDHVGFNVRGPVLLLGNPDDNPLIRFAVMKKFLPYLPKPDLFPGSQRGYLSWQRDAVSYGDESLTLIAYDDAGMTEAIGTLFAAARGMKPLMPVDPPALATITPPSRKTMPPPMPATRWELSLPDRVKRLKLLPNGDVMSLTEDGTLSRVRPDGKIAWSNTIDGGQYWYLDAAADGNTIVVGATQRVLAYDGRGKEKFVTAISEGGTKSPRITCLAVSPDGSRVFVSTANFIFDGFPQGGEERPWRAMLLSAEGKMLWQFGDVFKRDATPASIYRSALFTPDGSRIIALNRTDYFAVDGQKPGEYQAEILDAATGAMLGKIPKVNGWLGATPIADQVMLLDGDSTVSFVSPQTIKVMSQLTFPERGVVAAAVFGNRIIAGNEVGGHVWAVQSRSGNSKDNLTWSHAEPGLLVKQIVVNANRVAVSYWGGTLQIFDADGALVASQVFQQDIAEMVWSNDTLLVADADGRLLGLTTR